MRSRPSVFGLAALLLAPSASPAPAPTSEHLLVQSPSLSLLTYTHYPVPSAASFYVPTLPDLHQNPSRPLHIYAGHLPSEPKYASLPDDAVLSHLYFVLVKARRLADKERTLFWFNGGPGCSSFDGLMMEVGPWRMREDGQLYAQEGGWEEYTNIVYVDQPVGTGFSYGSTNRYVHELSEAADQFMEFVRNFYKVFPEYRSMDTYLGGESFAGQYIPYFADALLKSDLQVPFRGAAIGNGWIDAAHQYPAYLDYSVKHGLIAEGSAEYESGKKATDECMTVLNGADGAVPVHVDICEQLLGKISGMDNGAATGKCLNVYDVRLKDTYPECGMNWPPPLHNVTAYLRRKDVVHALHADAKSEAWTECQSTVHRQLTMRASNSSITVLPRVLERVPVLIFAGDQDLICNYVGLESMIASLTWNGATGLGEVETQTWTVANKPAGTWVSSRNMTYVKIFNASHMVGFDAPTVSHDMILRFMNVNLTALADGAARIPSAVGTDRRPALVDSVAASPGGDTSAGMGAGASPGKTPEQDKAMWEAYYNAGSAALVLVLVLLAIGIFLWCRVRSRRTARSNGALSLSEEAIPLTRDIENGNASTLDVRSKGKGRAREDEDTREDGQTVFEVGDSDDEEEDRRRR
ncbi:alpha/beta-hydrolase [Vararia minispora EC-137]|uniref:Alpha/beta-hydrolase n=1 Tax=Vararia minispora EC-137 TaxID=1314806 RepID=A0ACB8QM68_9AGAM|nr:alpha/beta-hydrolase [Vararia minispora EC-137]